MNNLERAPDVHSAIYMNVFTKIRNSTYSDVEPEAYRGVRSNVDDAVVQTIYSVFLAVHEVTGKVDE